MGALEGGSTGKQEEGSPQGSSVCVGGDMACVSQPTSGRVGDEIRRRVLLVK